MVWFFTPYSFQKKLFTAYDNYMNLIANPNDWVCFLDGDTSFLLPDFGHQIQQYIDKYPGTGMFTCYASRCHYSVQVRKGTDMANPDILYHYMQALTTFNSFHGKVKEIDRKVAGHLLVIQKKTWIQIRDQVKKSSTHNKILGVDSKISNAILTAGLKIRLMRGIYIFHFLRMSTNFGDKKHLE
ncbi:MAG: hypothetical protein HQ541_19505 [Mariniphaga sp.]|nr:hypothetical protein [Mariniphaga sp.]